VVVTGTVNYIELYILTPVGNGRVAIYDDDANGNTPTSLVVQSSEQVLTAGWNVFPIAASALSAAKIYWLACTFSASPTIGYYTNDPYDYKSVTHDMTYGAYTDPFVISFEAHYAFRYCLYATDVLNTPTATPLATSTFTPSVVLSATPTRTPTASPTRTITATPSITPASGVTPLPTATSIPTLFAWDKDSVVTYPSPAVKNHVWFYYFTEANTQVSIEIFNSVGERVAKLADQSSARGYQRTHWDIQPVSPGVYLYRVTLESPAGRRDLGFHKLVVVK